MLATSSVAMVALYRHVEDGRAANSVLDSVLDAVLDAVLWNMPERGNAAWE